MLQGLSQLCLCAALFAPLHIESIPEITIAPIEVEIAPFELQAPVPTATDSSSTASFAIIPEPPCELTAQQRTFIERLGQETATVRQADLYPSVMIAQAILESDWGRSRLSQTPNWNLFGIKGNDTQWTTREEGSEGRSYWTQAGFRQQASMEEAVHDYAALLGNSPYYWGTHRSQTLSYQEAAHFLTGRYATDHLYGVKVISLIQRYQLTRFDAAPPKEKRQIDFWRLSHPLVLTSNWNIWLQNHFLG
ncbi:hypothetical protein IV38_GL001986 [Lactobacillus selangorensis]|uniref:Mannosyl-glycoprotein endo-beta-N-acetylglucosamidase-like domain-containing protein n=1 Tax=Lactobacillus selangorensis TaxID=81857 RepID=A0A0R2FUW0_9LACO|nr:glucosaminidase domain-containing protein [Lactobacillus selangorensis]KRN27531.1 hypothetical protein IV38_GL001986 [Lactobacillus selangorensis]KRN30197.1 hypothetical protein IV40_GL002043 [Lactobacillus selangorensis]